MQEDGSNTNYEAELKRLRAMWKLADPVMRKVIEARANLLKMAQQEKKQDGYELAKEIFKP